jgi:hypothetical protein
MAWYLKMMHRYICIRSPCRRQPWQPYDWPVIIQETNWRFICGLNEIMKVIGIKCCSVCESKLQSVSLVPLVVFYYWEIFINILHETWCNEPLLIVICQSASFLWYKFCRKGAMHSTFESFDWYGNHCICAEFSSCICTSYYLVLYGTAPVPAPSLLELKLSQTVLAPPKMGAELGEALL